LYASEGFVREGRLREVLREEDGSFQTVDHAELDQAVNRGSPAARQAANARSVLGQPRSHGVQQRVELL